MSKLRNTLLMVLSSSCSLSNDNGFNGEYIGVSVSGISGKSEIKSQFSDLISTSLNSSDLSYSGGSIGLFAGYGKTINTTYVGAEFQSNVSNAYGFTDYQFINGMMQSGSIGLRKNNTFSLLMRVGKILDDKTLMYINGGVSYSNYRFKYSVTSNNLALSKIEKTSIIQPVIGVGLYREIAKIDKADLYLGTEYKHTFGKTKTVSISSGAATGSGRFDTSSDSLSIRLSIKF